MVFGGFGGAGRGSAYEQFSYGNGIWNTLILTCIAKGAIC
jgi:hypothetical protein